MWTQKHSHTETTDETRSWNDLCFLKKGEHRKKQVGHEKSPM